MSGKKYRPVGTLLQRFPLLRIIIAMLWVGAPVVLAELLIWDHATTPAWRLAGHALSVAVTLGAYGTYVHWIERRPVQELSGARAWQELGCGLVLGTTLFLLTIGTLSMLGAYRVVGWNGTLFMLATLPAFIQGAVLEEVMFRGVLFRILEQTLGSAPALVLSAALFGLLHLNNSGANLVSVSAVSLEAGLMLGTAYMVTRRLWLCIAIHLAWNFAQGGIFSVAVSGNQHQGLLKADMVGADWLTGGQFGAETSVVAVCLCVALGVYFLAKAKRTNNIIAPFWQPAHK